MIYRSNKTAIGLIIILATTTTAFAEGNNNPYVISPYQLTYLLPFYYTVSPDQAIYQNNTPDQQTIDPYEVKYQISFKVPLWQNIFDHPSTLYAAYTQLSYWQAYNQSAFFRETDYEPEIFLSNQVRLPIIAGWSTKIFNVGLVHQSNGRSGEYERSWNRAYAETISTKGNWTIEIKPWYVIHDNAMEEYNPNIARYLGYGQMQVSYKYHEQTFSATAQNMVESGFSRGALQLDWRFPLSKHVDGYVQEFNGYGQSLIEYNHYTNAIGIGVALHNLL